MPRVLHDIIKEYPDMHRILIYKVPYTPALSIKKKVKKLMLNDSNNYDETIKVSVRRTRRILHDYVKCNEFTHFATFTFNPKKVDRYDINVIYAKMQSWLRRQHLKNKNFQYLVVPEKHKDGAIHFHALLNNAPFVLKKTNVIQQSKRVYNIPAFRFGFTNVTKLDEKDKVATCNYIAKYITKDMITILNKRRYWSSRNLVKPKKYYNELYDKNLHLAVHAKNMVSDNDYSCIYEIDKNIFDE